MLGIPTQGLPHQSFLGCPSATWQRIRHAAGDEAAAMQLVEQQRGQQHDDDEQLELKEASSAIENGDTSSSDDV